MNFDIDEKQRDLIIGTMSRWLEGKKVWRRSSILKKWGREFECRRLYGFSRGRFNMKSVMRSMEHETKLMMLRHEWIMKFGFAIPCAELIEACRKHAPILDVGAGTGYMTRLLRNAGVEATGTDPFKNSYAFKGGAYDDKQLGHRASVAIKKTTKRTTVFCSWPSLHESWFHRALLAMHVGQHLIVIRESATGSEKGWAYLEANFRHEDTINIPCWPNMRDRCEVWVKTRALKP